MKTFTVTVQCSTALELFEALAQVVSHVGWQGEDVMHYPVDGSMQFESLPVGVKAEFSRTE